MLHLFKKVYVATDHIIDVSFDRVVISAEHGHDLLDSLKASQPGELLAFAKEAKNLIGSKELPYMDTMDMFDKLGDHTDATGKRVVIYCDNKAFKVMMALWFKLIFAKPNADACVDLLESMVFKYEVFNQGRFSGNAGLGQHKIDIEGFKKVFQNANKPTAARRKQFINENKAALSFEYLLATYLANGKMKKELKTVMKILLKKDLEKYLLELKETFFTHILTQRFTDTLGLDKTYDFTNYNEILKDKSEFPSLFMNKDIWKTPFMAVPSSGKNVNFDAITAKHIKSFQKFTELAGATWEEETIHQHVKSDVSKLDFVKAVSTGEITDKELEHILDVESSYVHEAGSFFSIDLETVNTYFVQGLLDGNKEFREQYAIM